ncbi:hypothetical protein Hanom_Chr07g00625111 [Helianthus anomalus]
MDEKILDELVRTHIKKWRDKNEKRMAELGDSYRSPYCNRITSLYEPLLERDQTIICYLLAPIENIRQVQCFISFKTLKILTYLFKTVLLVLNNNSVRYK